MKISYNLRQSWHLIKGSKLPILSALLVWLGTGGVLGFIVGIINHFKINVLLTNRDGILIITWITMLLTVPLFAGMTMIAIKRARGEPVSTRTGFQYFARWWPLAQAFLLMSIFTMILTTLFESILVAIFFLLAHFFYIGPKTFFMGMLLGIPIIFNIIYTFLIFTIPLIVDRQLSVLAAFRTSAKIAKTHWLRLFILLLICAVLNSIGLLICTIPIPFAGLICYIILNIWLVPFIFLNIGVAYHQLVDRELNYAQPLLSTN